jgi:hypothetical protein
MAVPNSPKNAIRSTLFCLAQYRSENPAACRLFPCRASSLVDIPQQRFGSFWRIEDLELGRLSTVIPQTFINCGRKAGFIIPGRALNRQKMLSNQRGGSGRSRASDPHALPAT